MYVDDIVITACDTEGILSLKSFLHIQTKDMEQSKYFLGIKVSERFIVFFGLKENMFSTYWWRQQNWVLSYVVHQ